MTLVSKYSKLRSFQNCFHFFNIFGNTSDNINDNMIIVPPINRFSVNGSCNTIMPINAAITLSNESSIPLVVAEICFIP